MGEALPPPRARRRRGRPVIVVAPAYVGDEVAAAGRRPALGRSAPGRGSRDPSVGAWLGGPENPPNGPGASGGPKCSYCDMGRERKMTRFRPPPNLRIFAAPARHLPSRPSRRRNRDYAMNFQWIFTILLFALVAPCAFTSISPPRCAGVRWLHVLVILVLFSCKHACLRWSLLVSRGCFRNHVSGSDRCAGAVLRTFDGIPWRGTGLRNESQEYLL